MKHEMRLRLKDVKILPHEDWTPGAFEPVFRESPAMNLDVFAQLAVLDQIRRGEITRARAAEILQMSIYDLPELLARHGIPWFDDDSLEEEGVEEDWSRPA